MEAQPSSPENGPDEADIASSPRYPTELLLTRPKAIGYRRRPRVLWVFDGAETANRGVGKVRMGYVGDSEVVF